MVSPIGYEGGRGSAVGARSTFGQHRSDLGDAQSGGDHPRRQQPADGDPRPRPGGARDAGLSDSARADVLEIVRAARQATLLTRQLAALRRPSADRSIVDLRSVVGAMGRMLWPLIGEAIELRTESGSRPIRVEADPADLEGIVLNLAINARDAMPDGGSPHPGQCPC